MPHESACNFDVGDRHAAARGDVRALDRSFFEQGITRLAGVDEAGRGPLAGPVCAAAVVFPPDFFIEGVNDSKKLTPRQREKLFAQITAQALGFGIGWADPREIDELNILRATKLAMRRALDQLRVQPELVLLDAVTLENYPGPQKAFVKGDARSHAIAAASILAKVARDRVMVRYESEFPGYGFARHKGYPTRQHVEALTRLGLTSIHRKSFAGSDFFFHGMRHSRSFERWAAKILSGADTGALSVIERGATFLPAVEFEELRRLAAQHESRAGL
jgi:ribonuclease HII